jgi:hypothetical protein
MEYQTYLNTFFSSGVVKLYQREKIHGAGAPGLRPVIRLYTVV